MITSFWEHTSWKRWIDARSQIDYGRSIRLTSIREVMGVPML
jgi:hypothetical protein